MRLVRPARSAPVSAAVLLGLVTLVLPLLVAAAVPRPVGTPDAPDDVAAEDVVAIAAPYDPPVDPARRTEGAGARATDRPLAAGIGAALDSDPAQVLAGIGIVLGLAVLALRERAALRGRRRRSAARRAPGRARRSDEPDLRDRRAG